MVFILNLIINYSIKSLVNCFTKVYLASATAVYEFLDSRQIRFAKKINRAKAKGLEQGVLVRPSQKTFFLFQVAF